MKETVGIKIKQGRVLKALSLEGLAKLVEVSKQMISKYENGISMPSSKMLIKLAKALEVQIDYFFTPSTIELGEVNFRKRSSFPIKKSNALKEEVKIKLSNYLEIENILQFQGLFSNPLKIVRISSLEEVEQAVIDIRNEWEIGMDPVHNIIQLLEDKGIKIIEINEPENKFDGLATMANEIYPVIVINENFSVERKRFTLLHELGHLLLELPGCDTREEENYCNRFASEFLFPKASVLWEFGRKRDGVSLKELVEVQKKYGISIRAIFYRLKDVGILSESKYISLNKKINFDLEFRSVIDEERFQTPEESNRYEQLVYRALSQELISSSKAASLLNVNINTVLESTFM